MSASSAPVSAMRCSSARRKRRPRRPVAGSSSRNDVPAAAAAAASIAARGHAARPRFVWIRTPVALITRVRPAADSNAPSRATTSAPTLRPTTRARPRRVAARSSSTTARATASTAPGSRSPRDGRAAASTRSTDGGRDASVVIDPPWTGGSAWESNPPRDAERRATGVEDRGAHRDPSAPTADGTAATTPATRSGPRRRRPVPLLGESHVRAGGRRLRDRRRQLHRRGDPAGRRCGSQRACLERRAPRQRVCPADRDPGAGLRPAFGSARPAVLDAARPDHLHRGGGRVRRRPDAAAPHRCAHRQRAGRGDRDPGGVRDRWRPADARRTGSLDEPRGWDVPAVDAARAAHRGVRRDRRRLADVVRVHRDRRRRRPGAGVPVHPGDARPPDGRELPRGLPDDPRAAADAPGDRRDVRVVHGHVRAVHLRRRVHPRVVRRPDRPGWAHLHRRRRVGRHRDTRQRPAHHRRRGASRGAAGHLGLRRSRRSSSPGPRSRCR